MCGLTNQDAKSWKATDDGKDQRQRMKALQLGINYGMGVRSLARGLDRHPMIGSEVIIRHQQRYPTFWSWRADMSSTRHAGARDRVRVRRLAAAPEHVPEQAHALQFSNAERRRRDVAACGQSTCDAGLVPIMLVHDGILFELDNEEQVQHAIEIMRQSEHVPEQARGSRTARVT